MREGLYEKLVSLKVAEELASLAPHLAHELREADKADLPRLLSRHVAAAVERHLEAKAEGVSLINSLLEHLTDESDEHLPDETVRLLTAVRDTSPLAAHRPYDKRPETPLSDVALLTNGRTEGEPTLLSEIQAELASADRVDLLCAFVMWHGIRLLEDELRTLKRHDVPIRIITSTYTGCTDRRTLDRLVKEFGAEVKVHYETSRTRLHAKAWLFHRNTGFHTGYVGSSNLSSSALVDGAEWNVRISSLATPSLLNKFDATFDSYWNDPAFETYDPDRDADRLDAALAAASGRASAKDLILSGLAVTPFPHQRLILEQLAAERATHGRHRNLVVAATGTGKTVVAALDYAGICSDGERPSLLFVAHRQEILEQARRTYAEVLKDPTFGELCVGGQRPVHWKHVFASVQSLNALGLDGVDPAAYDVIVIDEFHHSSAPSYRRLIDYFHPKELLGLTATPERGDGVDVAREFFDGRTAAEVRLWDALASDLLTPFHYFAVGDTVDLRKVPWGSSRYDVVELERLYAGNESRARHVMRTLENKVSSLEAIKTIGFCVSVAHADFMAEFFSSHGVPAEVVSGESTPAHRSEAISALRRGDIKAIFTVDVFNEGIDIPEINTVLFLRPTESPTVFVQQLGRGLRLANNKPVLTALDFVGHQRAEYRWDRKLRAVAKSMSRQQLTAAVKGGFDLPGGSQIMLDELATEIVLTNLRNSIPTTWKALAQELRQSTAQTLREFIEDVGLDLSDVLRNNKSWTTLRREAQVETRPAGAQEAHLVKRVRALVHVDDQDRYRAYRALLADEVDLAALDTDVRRYAPMLFFSLWPNGGGFASVEEGLAALAHEPAVRDEMRQVLDFAFDATRVTTQPAHRADLPLRVHARYTREELLAAIGYVGFAENRFPAHAVAGVYRVDERKLDALLVTTVKTESGFSPTTMYRDYAISRSKFHWESQAVTRADSRTGLRYINHATTDDDILLFARQHKVTYFGGGAPFVYLGPATYAGHTGERPMAITWDLANMMPEATFQWASVV